METQSNTKYFAISAALLLAGVVIGIFADPYLPASLSNTKKGYATGFDAARTLVEKSGLGNFSRTPDDVRSISGVVTAISGNRMTLRLVSNNPFDDQNLNERSVLIAANTKIIKLVAKDPKAFQAELTEFNKTPQAGSAPQPFTQVIVGTQDIKTGELLTVTAPENIKMMKEFTASEIRIELTMMSK